MAKDKKPEINDLIFKELIKRGYSLEGNTRIWNIADSKLWYLTSDQAQAFLDLEEEPEYKKNVSQKEIGLLEEMKDQITSSFGQEPLNVIDIGCGDGRKAAILIKQFDRTHVRYCPIDISSYMVDKAINAVRGMKKVDEVVEFQWNISDFENIENVSALLRQGKYKRNLFLLLGNTLGNFEINELLYEIRSAMKEGDFLLIGNGLDNRHPNEILRSYDSSHFNKFSMHPLLLLGLKAEDLQFGVRFKNSRIESYYTIKRAQEIKFLNRSIKFEAGDQVIVVVSYKYSKADFSSFLNLYFDKVLFKTDKGQGYILALCKK